MQQNSLLVAVDPPRAFVRVKGRGSFQNSTALKKFAASAISRDCRELIVDMFECAGMDSTFMGVLAGAALRLRKAEPPGKLVMTNLDSKNKSLLDTLGLSRILKIDDAISGDTRRGGKDLTAGGGGAMDRLASGVQDRSEAAETMLQAHKDLALVAPENSDRFKDVIAYLDEDMRRNRETEKKNGDV